MEVIMLEPTRIQLEDNYNLLVDIIKNTFGESDRTERLLKMYDDLKDRMKHAPASAKEHFHYAFIGGYVKHILHVVEYARKFHQSFEEGDGNINYTEEELVFSALHHDLGKVGDIDNEYYSEQDSEWHKNNRGEVFKMNPKITYMGVTDRALYLLQHYGITVTQNEWMAIKLSDGIYDEGNKSYYITYDPAKKMKINLPYIIHLADMFSTLIEYSQWSSAKDMEITELQDKFNKLMNKPKNKINVNKQEKDSQTKILKNKFDELFSN